MTKDTVQTEYKRMLFDLPDKQLNLIKTFLAALFVSAAAAMSSFVVIFDKICPSPVAGKKILQDNACLIILFLISMIFIGLGLMYGLQSYYIHISSWSKQIIHDGNEESLYDKHKIRVDLYEKLVGDQNIRLHRILRTLYVSTAMWVLVVSFLGTQALHAKFWQ